jgi:hypothetical protein
VGLVALDPGSVAVIGSALTADLSHRSPVPLGTRVTLSPFMVTSMGAVSLAFGLRRRMSRTAARSYAHNEAVFREVKSFGDDVVLPDKPDDADRAREIIGNAPVPLAVGGPSSMNLLSLPYSCSVLYFRSRGAAPFGQARMRGGTLR